MIGKNQQSQEKVQNLARLVSNQDDFAKAFKSSNQVEQQDNKVGFNNNTQLTQSQSSTNRSRVNVILNASRVFRINAREYDFDEMDAIFFV